MKVLIVDDSPDALVLARARLAREALDVITADGGAAGLEAALAHHPDLILLDVDMPEMSGFDVCRRLKAEADLCMVPVIFLTGSDQTEDKVKGLDLGAVDYVTKPFDAFELRARVNAALRTKHMQDLLIEHASIDPLTEMPNRRALMARLEQEWARILRHSGSLSLIMADIDHFKRVNDTLGHRAGDRVLQSVARALAAQCRQVDLPARYGGEEFAVIVPDQPPDGAHVLAERCREAIASTSIRVEDNEIRVTASFGVAGDTGLSSPVELIEQADEALYHAKHNGRNQVARVSSTPGAALPT